MSDSKTPFFSLVSVTYDNLAGLRATGASVAAQDCGDYEWIVIDGGSGDGTADYLHGLPEHEGPGSRLSWVSEPDGGIYDAMNKGLERAAGEYVLFLNAGDTLADGRVLSSVRAACEQEPEPPGFVYGDGIEGGRYKRAKSHEKHIEGMFTHHQAMFYRRASLGTLRYDTAYKISADYGFTVRFLKSGAGVLRLPFAVCVFETGGISQRQASEGRAEQSRIRLEFGLCSKGRDRMIRTRQAIGWIVRSMAPELFWGLAGGANCAQDTRPLRRPAGTLQQGSQPVKFHPNL